MNPRHVVLCALTSALALAPSLAHANPVNAEVLRPSDDDGGLSGTIAGSLTLRSGNVDLLDFSLGGRIQYLIMTESDEWGETPDAEQRRALHTFFVTANARNSTRGEDVVINRGFAHARWTGMWWPSLGTEVFTQLSFNEFLLLKTRALLGTNLRAELVSLDALQIWLGSGYMAEYSEINVPEGASDPPEMLEHRWTNYMTLRAELFEGNLLVQDTCYFQPRFDDFSDFRLFNVLEVLVPVTENLALGTNVSILHDSRPPTSVEPTDVRVDSTIKISF